ncbi:DUF6526 family protein [Bacillus sp. DJP31]|uniref:DUF6526 family protein n=1 Tax=Bacillus sp. DJP31 TaxID=3409789 RepID=UPI003BB6D74E
MKKQSYDNHRQFPMFHGGILLSILISLILSVIFFIQNLGEQMLLSFIVLLSPVIFLLLAIKARGYGLKLQDRIIRNEENFRSFQLTGKIAEPRLTLGQIIALRFASDEEYPALVTRAIDENLSANEIKKAVNNWRSDFHRV